MKKVKYIFIALLFETCINTILFLASSSFTTTGEKYWLDMGMVKPGWNKASKVC